MDYKDYLDGELYMLICEENEEAKEIIFNKYKYIIDIVIKKYSFTAFQLNIDYKELYSEALLGFTDALGSYQDNKDTSISTFISLCINRRLKKAIVHAMAQKNKLLTESYSLDHIYKEFNVPLIELISDSKQSDPLENMSNEEEYNELLVKIKTNLSSFEIQVFDLLINGFNYNEIALLLNKTPKQIDNTIQRIKPKTKKVIKEKN